MSRENPSAIRLWDVVRQFLPYHRRYITHYIPYLLSVIAGITISGIIIPLTLRRLIDIVALSGGTPEPYMPTLYALLGLVACWSAAHVFMIFTGDFFITYVAPKIMRDIENDCFKVIHRLPLSYFASTHVGSIVAKVRRFSAGYNLLDLHITRDLLHATVLTIGSVIVVSRFAPVIAAIFVVWGLSYIGVLFIVVRWKLTMDIDKVRADSVATGILTDGVTNFLAVKMFASFNREYERYATANDAVERAMRRSWIGTTVLDATQGIIIALVTIVILFLTLLLWSQGRLSIGTIFLVQTYVLIVGSQFTGLGLALKNIYRSAADCMEMMEIKRIVPDVLDPAIPEPSRITAGQIDLENITFAYHPGKPVFTDFSLSIPVGQRIGIVGRSGAGKSTIVSLLLRLMDVQSGSIRIDGQDIRSIIQDDLRNAVSYVPQEPLLFHRTIRENILYGKPTATDAEIIDASTKAYAHEFIQGLPSGYDTIVGERGIKLSGGERQRIAIARAMLKDSPILVLDEATSSLDSVSETYIREAFDSLVRNRTTVVIAHRLSTIQRLDRIIVLDQGRIVEEGTHAELLIRKGVYAELWAHQADGFLGV